MSELDQKLYVGKVYRHTAKAVKAGHPGDRLFFVVGAVLEKGERKPWLQAWKVTINPDGTLDHPWFKRPVKVQQVIDTPSAYFMNGISPFTQSDPTAAFYVDSYYEEVDLNTWVSSQPVKKVSKSKLKEIELNALYEAWAGEEARKTDAEGKGFFMVIVNRFMNLKGRRFIKRSEYYFSTEECARKCGVYWLKRGGLVNLIVIKVLEEWGFTEEPDLYGGA